MRSKEIERIIEKVRPYAEILEEYDRTGKWPLKKVRKNFTLEMRSVSRLEQLAKKKDMSQSDVLDELIQKAAAR